MTTETLRGWKVSKVFESFYIKREAGVKKVEKDIYFLFLMANVGFT